MIETQTLHYRRAKAFNHHTRLRRQILRFLQAFANSLQIAIPRN